MAHRVAHGPRDPEELPDPRGLEARVEGDLRGQGALRGQGQGVPNTQGSCSERKLRLAIFWDTLSNSSPKKREKLLREDFKKKNVHFIHLCTVLPRRDFLGRWSQILPEQSMAFPYIGLIYVT